MQYFYVRDYLDPESKKGHPLACMAFRYLDGVQYQISRCSFNEQFEYSIARRLAGVRLVNIPLRPSYPDNILDLYRGYWVEEVRKIKCPHHGNAFIDILEENQERFSKFMSCFLNRHEQIQDYAV